MLRNVFTKSLYDQRRALVGWGAAVFLLVFAEAALWPSIRSMPDLHAFLSNYPEAMRKLFNLEDFGTGAGYLNTELFSALLPILFIIFGVGRGARAVAGEEEAGTLDAVLVTRVSNIGFVLQEAAALAVTVGALGVTLLCATLLSSVVFGLGAPAAAVASATLAMVLIGLLYGWLALAVGAVTGRRAVAMATSTIAAVAAYVLYVAGQLVDAIRPWQPLSPFYQALHHGPVAAGVPLTYVWLGAVAVVVLVASLPVFDRRDIRSR